MSAPHQSPPSAFAGDIPDYWTHAECNTGDGSLVSTFFPDHGKGGSAYKACRDICGRCPVVEQCLATALRQEELGGGRHGFAGGMTPPEREQYARSRR